LRREMRKQHLALLMIVAALLWLAMSCDEGTGAQRVELETFLVGIGGAEPFENVPPSGAEPWTVTLDAAFAALGPVYLFEGDPLLTRLFQRLLLPRAYAHPGHYQEGAAMGEVLDQRVLDLLAPEPTRLGLMKAVTGECHSAQVGIGTADVGIAGAESLEGHALLLRGVATREDSEAIRFQAWLDLDVYIEGIAFEHEIDDQPGRIVVEVDLQRWLRRVDFATAEPGDTPESPALLSEGTQAHNALMRGVDNTLAYQLRWEADNESGD